MKNNLEKQNDLERKPDPDELKAKLNKIFAMEDDDERDRIQEKIVDFVDIIRQKYPDYTEYRFYHILAGSTPMGELSKFDFPGDDSVEKFINNL